MYEKHHQPVLSRHDFALRVLQAIGKVLPIVLISLITGMVGYKYLEGMGWIDALYNASMIMSGMGPAAEMHTAAGKLFASAYALYSGLFLIAVTGYLLSPFFHRVIHKFHQP